MDEAREAAWRKASPSGDFDGKNGIRSVERFAFELGWEAGVDWAQDQQDQQDEYDPFRPGQYRLARGITLPVEGEPSVEDTIRAMRDAP